MAPQPPVGRGGGPAYGNTPFGGYEQEPDLSPAEARALEIDVDKGVGARLRQARSIAPSLRQQTRAELINLTLLYEQLGNPFSIRRIPFSVLRDMLTDPMINFALFYTKVPLIRADWYIEGPDAQLNAAVDAALRPVNSALQTQFCGKLGFGYQPMCKRFKLGPLRAFYRDPYGDDPDKDIPVWDSSVDALLWEKPQALAPEHCLPRWNERGDFDGFYYSIIPLPNPIQIGTANLYGYSFVPGYEITNEFAMWPVNEQEESYGSIYGSPRIKRAYRYFWSYWYRWALADRAFENLADPPKYAYYPTDVTEAVDVEDTDPTNPTVVDLQRRALALLDMMRSGTGLAIPGDFAVDHDGKMTGHRKWEFGYFKPEVHFEDLSRSFGQLDALKFRSCMIPEQAFIEGTRSSSSGSQGGTSRLMGIQLGEVYQESQQLLADENDEEVNRLMIPQFIASNYPEKAGTPCRKVTRGFGAHDTDLVKQIIQLIGQMKGEVLPVDMRELLRQVGMPLLTEQQQKKLEAQIAKEAEAMQPSPFQPSKVGMQGHNAGVERTATGLTRYVQPPQHFDLDYLAVGDFVSSLPDVPAYKDATVRSNMMRLRKMMLERYKSQVDSFAEHISSQTTLHLAQQTLPQQGQAAAQGTQTPQQAPQKQGLSPQAAAGIAATIVGTWSAIQAAEAPGRLAMLLAAIARRAGQRELKLARLGSAAVDDSLVATWASQRQSYILNSIDSTIRQEMTNFLEDALQRETDPAKVAEMAKERFSDTPQTHADRVVLTETLPAYNFGALSAFQDAGVSQVMAHDASDGQDELTDAECRAIDGRVMSISDALKAQDHPYGTRWFSPLSTDSFTVQRVDRIPLHLNGQPGHLAAYDQETETLYVTEEASEEEEREFALVVGSGLTLR